MALFGKQKLFCNLITISTSILLLVALTLYIQGYFEIHSTIRIPIIFPNSGLFFSCSIEGLAFAFTISFLWILANLYAIGYMKNAHETHQKRFFFFFTLSIPCALGIAFSGKLTTMFVFYELLTLATYPLIINRVTENTLAAGKTYLRFLLGSSLLLLLPAIAVTYVSLSGTDFDNIKKIPDVYSGSISSIIFIMFLYGTAKAGVMPVHKWLITAMIAQTPVSALLHAVAVVKVGVFLIIKTDFYIFGTEWIKEQNWLVFLVSFTIIASSIEAFKATHLKVRLAYSTISQLSYIILFAIISENVMLPITYMVLHAFAKITLFFAAGAISTQAKTQEISQLGGIGKSMPWTMTCFAVSAFSLIGLPFTGMFVGKTFLLTSAGTSHMHLFIVAIITCSTLLNTLYFLPIIYHSFFGNKIHKCAETDWAMRLPMVITACSNIPAFWIFIGY
ncbi:MAG: hypothetical protein HRK26_00845 [Rickettsiaceae bacterium H1]|nr:hypothetical protein [Rickettsiaceae bacterium H1]